MIPEDGELQSRLKAARRAIVEHPGYREHQELEALHLSLAAVFVPNWRFLLAYLDAAATDVDLAFELIQNVRPPVVRDRFQAETTRHLHNYLSSVYSLVEHVRRLLRGRASPFVEDFNVRKGEFLAVPGMRFIADLRAFTQHRVLPFLGHTLSVKNVNKPDQEMESEVELASSQLLEWEGWTAAARTYLREHPKSIKLRPLVRQHGQGFLGLNAWLLNALGEANAEPLAEVNQLVVQANAIFTDGDLAEAERLAHKLDGPHAGALDQIIPGESKEGL